MVCAVHRREVSCFMYSAVGNELWHEYRMSSFMCRAGGLLQRVCTAIGSADENSVVFVVQGNFRLHVQYKGLSRMMCIVVQLQWYMHCQEYSAESAEHSNAL